MKRILTLMIFSLSTFAASAGPIASGGVPETPFQYDRAAIQTILETDEILSILKMKGRILSIQHQGQQPNVYLVTTEKCQLHVQFERKCIFNGLPQCVSTSRALLNQSVGDCR